MQRKITYYVDKIKPGQKISGFLKEKGYSEQKCEEWLLTQEVVEKFIIKGDSINGND